MRGLEERQSREVKEITHKLQLQEEATNTHKARKAKLSEITQRLTDKQTQTDTRRRIITCWRDYLRWKKHMRHMNVFCVNYANRRFPHTIFNVWKDSAHDNFRSRAQQVLTQAASETANQVREQCSSDLNALRGMVEHLTEDLRRETVAKNTLRFKHENALMRGVDAVMMESMALQQETLERDREISLLTRSLHYASPDRSQD